MARAIFKDWFVDFGPTRAKMEGRPPYLAPDLWSLFPNSLNAEGLPEGWRIVPLAALTTELRRGLSPTYVETGGVRVVNQKCIRNRILEFSHTRRHDDTVRGVDGRTIEPFDVLINSTGVGTLGRVAQVHDLSEVTIADSHVTIVRPDQAKTSALYLGLNLTGRESEIESLGEGSTGQTELSRARVAALPVLVPDPSLLDMFDQAVGPIIKKVSSNTEESGTLAALRDLLLPKLMSGEIRLKEAERQLEEVL